MSHVATHTALGNTATLATWEATADRKRREVLLMAADDSGAAVVATLSMPEARHLLNNLTRALADIDARDDEFNKAIDDAVPPPWYCR